MYASYEAIKRNWEFYVFCMWMPPLFVFTKEILKNTKENMPSEEICSHFSLDGLINLRFSPDCCICIAFLIDTHIGCYKSHIAIWPYGHISKLWPYSHIAIRLYGSQSNSYGCLWKEQYKCSNMVEKLN